MARRGRCWQGDSMTGWQYDRVTAARRAQFAFCNPLICNLNKTSLRQVSGSFPGWHEPGLAKTAPRPQLYEGALLVSVDPLPYTPPFSCHPADVWICFIPRQEFDLDIVIVQQNISPMVSMSGFLFPINVSDFKELLDWITKCQYFVIEGKN